MADFLGSLIAQALERKHQAEALQKLQGLLQSQGAGASPPAAAPSPPPIIPLPAPQPAPQGGAPIQGGNWVNDSANFFNPHIAALGQLQGAAPDPAAARAAAARDLVQTPAQVPTSGGAGVTTGPATPNLYRTFQILQLAKQAGVPLDQLVPFMRAQRFPGAYQGLEGHPVMQANMANNKSVAYPWAMNSSGQWNQETGSGGWSPSMQSQVGVDRARAQALGAQQQKLETQADFPAKVGGKTVRAFRDDNGQIRYRAGPDGKPLEWTAEPKTFAPGQHTKTPDNPDNFYWQRVADYQRQVYDPKKARAMADSDYQARYGHPYSPGAGQETAGAQPEGGTSQQTQLIEQAREAVKSGVPRSFVEQKLKEYGVDPGAL